MEKAIKSAKPPAKVYEIPKTGEGSWTSTKISGVDLAAKVGKAMQAIRNTEARTLVTISTHGPSMSGGNGQVTSQVKIQDPKHYSIQYAVVGLSPESTEVRASGAQRAFYSTKGTVVSKKPVSSPAPEASLKPDELAQRWPKDFPRLVFLGVTDGKDPWKPLFDQLISGKAGFKTEVAERTLPWKGGKVTSYRLLATRTPEAAKIMGPCQIEMVFDGKRSLPVTIKVNTTVPKEGEYKINWSTGWSFNKQFNPEEFKF